jgi:hypothetical protein
MGHGGNRQDSAYNELQKGLNMKILCVCEK